MEFSASLAEQRRAAMDWEAGCVHDLVRRDFVAPTISRLMARTMPLRVLDVGAGTGFISRIIDEQLAYRAHWTLIDRDAERLALAKANASSSMNISVVCADIIDDQWACDTLPYDAILICFTILEFQDYKRLLEVLYTKLRQGGTIVIVVPDPWEELSDDPILSKSLLTERISINKTDKFTNSPYPYYIVRTEMIIESVIKHGFALDFFTSSKSGQPVYVMAFSQCLSLVS